jgi:hypothetical protein
MTANKQTEAAMADDRNTAAVPDATIISVPVVCQLLMLSRQRIDQLVNDGWLKRVAKGQFSLVDAVQGYIRFLRDEHRRQNVSAADSRVRDARARDIETRTAIRLSQLVPREIYDEMIDGFAGVVRSEFAGLAAASTRDLPTRRAIDREVNVILRRIAEYALAQALRMEAVRGIDPAVGADGAGHMGGGKSDLSANGGGAGAA